jgi:hypothetical protein
MSSIRHGLTDRNGPPHSAQRSRAESCAMVRPNEMRIEVPVRRVPGRYAAVVVRCSHFKVGQEWDSA